MSLVSLWGWHARDKSAVTGSWQAVDRDRDTGFGARACVLLRVCCCGLSPHLGQRCKEPKCSGEGTVISHLPAFQFYSGESNILQLFLVVSSTLRRAPGGGLLYEQPQRGPRPGLLGVNKL